MNLRYRLMTRLGLVEPLVRLQRWADRTALEGTPRMASSSRAAETVEGPSATR
jgi:hypothetical protein